MSLSKSCVMWFRDIPQVAIQSSGGSVRESRWVYVDLTRALVDNVVWIHLVIHSSLLNSIVSLNKKNVLKLKQK